jgi:hypothetical protein
VNYKIGKSSANIDGKYDLRGQRKALKKVVCGAFLLFRKARKLKSEAVLCSTMPRKKFDLSATVSSDNPSAVKPVLEKIIGSNGSIKETDDGFEIHARLEGESAKDFNRLLLSEMRRAEKRTRLRSEWTSNKTVERFFDYVPKGTRKIE